MLKICKGGVLKCRRELGLPWKVTFPDINMTGNCLSTCEIAKGVTLGDIFTMMKKDKLICEMFGLEALGFFEELEKDPSEEMEKDKYLELYWLVVIEDAVFMESLGFHLMGKDDIPEGVCLTLLNNLKDYRVVINNRYNIYTENEKLLECKKEMRLIDILGSIMWELTWFGGAAQRNKRREEFDNMIVDSVNANDWLKANNLEIGEVSENK